LRGVDWLFLRGGRQHHDDAMKSLIRVVYVVYVVYGVYEVVTSDERVQYSKCSIEYPYYYSAVGHRLNGVWHDSLLLWDAGPSQG
jgi:hypothetical protein